MLSENPPPDPSSSYQFPPLNSNRDDRVSASDHKPPEVLDLPISNLHHHPNFSIRDYVFTARSKDIKKNWPFSLKNLQLCLDHGVKDLLPPLKPLNRCVVETSSVEKEKTGNYAAPNSNSDNPQLNNKPVDSCLDTSSSRSENENAFPSTTTASVLDSEIESLAVNRLSGNNCNKTTENTCKPLSKKCKFTLKFSGSSDRSSTEDIASTSITLSETMASKVCPVCKTFSSSSNTTLNAHIDQCLSTESTPKWASDSKLIRHRIKPRRIRMMVDIYTTALPCTLEELDRRNGTSWAAVSSLPFQEVEKSGNPGIINEGNKKRVSQVHPEDIGDIGPVYIDANGTKLRMLSKFDEQPVPVSKVREVIEARKPQKGDKGSKFISKKMRKRLELKHHKFLKFASQSKMKFSHKPHGSQIVEADCEGEAKSCEDEHMVSNKTKPSDSVTLRPWVCSKPRGLTKKTSQEGHQPVRCNWHLPQDLLSYNDQPFSGDTRMDKNVAQKFTNPPENSTSSAAKNDGIEKSFGKVQVSKKREQSPGRRKRMGNLLAAVKPTSIQLENRDTSMNDSRTTKPSDSSLLRKRTFHANFDTTCTASTKSSHQNANAIPSQRMRFSTSVTESVLGKVNMSQLQLMKKRNEEGGVSRKDQEHDISYHNEENQDGRAETAYDSPEMNNTTVLEPSLRFYDHNLLINTHSSSFGADDDFLPEENQVQPSCDERSGIKSMGSEIYELSNSLNAQQRNHSLQSVEDYRRLLCAPTEPDYVNDRDMFCAEVYPIPIPGPPGSFLPSPRGMGSEDFQGNSSLTIHSSLYQDDVVDGDLSDSPMSAASIISTADRSNFKSAAAIAPQESSAEVGFNRSLSLKNEQPCCCQRKERLSLNFQESHLLRRRKMDYNPNIRSTNMDVGSELSPGPGPPSSCLSPGSMKPLASPSTSSPVLRLMGKNLLVVNKDSDKFGGAQPHSHNNPHSPQFLAFSEGSPGNIHNHRSSYFGSQASVIYEGGFLNCCRSLSSDARLPVNAQLPAAGMFRDQRIASGFQHAESSRNPVKERIILDDVPENSDSMHPLSCYQSQEHRLVAEWVKERNASCHTTLTKPGPVSSSAVMHLNPFAAAPSSSPGHIRSAALHYSPAGFS